MTDQTFHLTREDIRKLESRESRRYHGQVPADADSSILKVTLPLLPPTNTPTNPCTPVHRRPKQKP